MVTLDDVARQAGVSRTTASRAMNGISTVHPERAATVLAAAEMLGFRPNPAARSLARGRHDAVALIVPEADMTLGSNSFFSIALHGAIREVAKSQQQLVMILRADGEPDEKFLKYLESSHIDGALVILEAHNTELPKLLARTAVPVVYLGRPIDSATDPVSYVDADSVGGGRLAAESLIAAGCRNLGVVAGPASMGITVDRLSGWTAALHESGLDSRLVAHSDFLTTGGEAAMHTLLDLEPELDGVFAMSDLMAAGALSTLRARGRRVPEDVSVISFDDTVISTMVEPKLTTIRQPVEELGALMVRALGELISSTNGEPVRITLPTTMVWRDSVRKGLS
ncbi:MAG: LacI family DNA-binding transcriptional regulator [Rhodoglobus sp.]